MQIAPSVLASDFLKLGEEMLRTNTADYMHLDIMDGHFVPNISYGPAFVKTLRKATDVPFDVHLMISHPLKYLEEFADAGADIICFHLECEDNTDKVIEKIKALGKKPALALKPGTPATKLLPYLDKLFMVLIMTVEPGFGGQKFMAEQIEKVRFIKSVKPEMTVEVDGGVNRETIDVCREAGVDICVAGTAVFGAEDPKAEIDFLRGDAR